MPLEGQQAKRLVKFDPTVNSGTIIQIAVIVVTAVMAFSTVKTELATQRVEIEANKATATRDNSQTAEALKELKADVKELQKSTNDVKESLAILRGRNPEGGSRK